MPWCPKCKYEYREGYTTCNDWGSELVKELEPEERGDKKEEEYEIIEDDVEAFLITVDSNVEAIILEAKLSAYNIPTLRKYNGFGPQFSVAKKPGLIDIYVTSKLLETAKALIKNEKED